MSITQDNVLHKDDAVLITDLKKSEYINQKTLELIPQYFRQIRESTLEMKYEVHITLEKMQFIPEIVVESAKVLKESGYYVGCSKFSYGKHVLRIYWRELSEYEKKNEI